MSSPKRKRDVPVLFWVSAAEMDVIQQKMAQFGTKNLSAYLRKMAVDGYVVQLDLPEGTGIPAAPKQQQLKPADTQGA